ncbi:MAG: shikimate dehydrogenase [Betaproteobacteria bacterium]|nr:shikimate dehydrogenase [Betaproteobacteria bacterium]
MTDAYAVIGNPVAHSKSPQIHAAFARETGQAMVYTRLPCELGKFAATVRAFRDGGGRGLNVTVPFKHEAYALCTQRSARAEVAGAVNTLSFNNGEIVGDNTDGVGLTRDITRNLRVGLRGASVLLLGAGGASFGVLGPLLAEAPAQLIIANRTLGKAQALAARFAAQAGACNLAVSGFAELRGRQFSVVINATSAGLNDDMPPLPPPLFAPGALAYDMVYGKDTPFLQFAQTHGATVADGLGMLVEQAAESFFVWRGVRPGTAPVIAMLRAKA